MVNISFAQQYANLNVKLGEYTFVTKYDTSNLSTEIRIKRDGKTIYKEVSEFPIMDIKEYDLDANGQNEILIDMYSGGAHCCTYLCAARLKNGKLNILDTIYWGNSFYSIRDLNEDGKYEILGANDIFAYAFTNYAESEFPILIYAFKNSKFINVTEKFPKLIEENIDDLMNKLRQFSDTGFTCTSRVEEDTFNTDAGAVKAILAPIVADYYTLGQVKKGYELVDSVYKCPDKDKFIEILQNDYKLK